jgi:hypothetical protein
LPQQHLGHSSFVRRGEFLMSSGGSVFHFARQPARGEGGGIHSRLTFR